MHHSRKSPSSILLYAPFSVGEDTALLANLMNTILPREDNARERFGLIAYSVGLNIFTMFIVFWLPYFR